MDWIMGRSKKKDKDPTILTTSTTSSDDFKFPANNDIFFKKLVENSSFKAAVCLPNGLDVNEWIASHTLSLFDGINLMCSCLHEFCSQATCPTMSGPNNLQFCWLDEKGKKLKLSAAQYTELVTSYIHTCANNENIFPTKYGNPFPPNFRRTIEHLHRLMSHLLIHAHHVHLQHLIALDLSIHYCTVLYHFLLFNKLFNTSLTADISIFDEVFKVLDTPVNIIQNDGTVNDDSKNNVECNLGNHNCSDKIDSNDDNTHVKEDKNVSREDLDESDSNIKSVDTDLSVNNYVPVFTIVT